MSTLPDRDRTRVDLTLANAIDATTASERTFTLDELAEAAGIPATLVRAVEDAGLPVGSIADGEARYSSDDLELLRSGMRLLDAGFPLEELLALARRNDENARALAAEAVDLFDRYVREPRKHGDDAAAAEVADAFATLLPAVTRLIGAHFRRVLLEIARARLA